MVFSSATFVLLFLPIVFLVTLASPANWRNLILLAASLLFYGWGEPIYILLMILCGFINYLFALRMTTKASLIANVIFNIGLLAVFKYADFFILSLNNLFGWSIATLNLPLPVGISFYTFQTMSYVIDVYRGQIQPQKSFLNVLLYITFFPQLIAGPIVVYRDIERQMIERSMDLNNITYGVRRFIIGLAKKLIVANAVALMVDRLYAQSDGGTLSAWVAGVCYLLQIYFDFSGYSDMAIGLGRMFGFHFKENFNYPYIAQSIQDFWRRWHISLSTWFRDYVYFPLGGNRRGVSREISNKLFVFFLTGLWHGAAWTFVAWGLFHGLFLLLERKWLKLARWPRVLRHLYTLFVVLVGFILFRADSFTQAFEMIRNLVWYQPDGWQSLAVIRSVVTPYFGLVVLIGFIGATPVLKRIKLPQAVELGVTLILWFVCLLTLSASNYNPFIYFRF